MTQREKLRQVLGELGIAYEERFAASQAYSSEEGSVSAKEWETSIDLKEGMGLPGLVTSFYFDEEESFLGHRVWKAA
jgi:hypothetical protein